MNNCQPSSEQLHSCGPSGKDGRNSPEMAALGCPLWRVMAAGLVLKPEAVSQLVSCLLYPEHDPSTPHVQYGSGLAQAFHLGDILQVLSGENIHSKIELVIAQFWKQSSESFVCLTKIKVLLRLCLNSKTDRTGPWQTDRTGPDRTITDHNRPDRTGPDHNGPLQTGSETHHPPLQTCMYWLNLLFSQPTRYKHEEPRVFPQKKKKLKGDWRQQDDPRRLCGILHGQTGCRILGPCVHLMPVDSCFKITCQKQQYENLVPLSIPCNVRLSTTHEANYTYTAQTSHPLKPYLRILF
jgi:hypothetical protein